MKNYFKFKLWILDLVIVFGLSILSGKMIMSGTTWKIIVGSMILMGIVLILRKVGRIVKAIREIEEILEKTNK